MDKLFNFNLTDQNELSRELLSLGVSNFKDAIIYIQNLPYGRNTNRGDYTLIIKEQKGTCSTKHAFLAALAIQENISGVKLFLGIYKMCAKNTTGVLSVLEKWQLPFLPEAHCYLKINEVLVDVTRNFSNTTSFENSLFTEEEILPLQIGEYKVKRHYTFLKNWITAESIPYDFKTIWYIREACIKSLSEYQTQKNPKA